MYKIDRIVHGYPIKYQKFFIYFKVLVRQVKESYPEWVIRIYHDASIKQELICEMECFKDESGLLMNTVNFCDIETLHHSWNGPETLSQFQMHGMVNSIAKD